MGQYFERRDATVGAVRRSCSDFAKMRMHSQGRTVQVREPPGAALLPLPRLAAYSFLSDARKTSSWNRPQTQAI